MLYACYSEKMSIVSGTVFYLRPDGSEVEVTSVEDNPSCENTYWDDKVLVGEVVKYVRKGRQGQLF